MAGRVLLTNGCLRKTLVAVRALGRAGIPCTVTDHSRVYPAVFSKYARAVRSHADPAVLEKQLEEWRRLQAVHSCDVLFPMDDDTMSAAVALQSDLAKGGSRLVVPTQASFQTASDKGATIRAAVLMGISVPHTIELTDLLQLTDICSDISYPVVIKPRHSSGSRGIRIARSKAELAQRCLDVHALYPWPLLQEYIEPGIRYDVCLLYNQEGRLKASFVQRELRHFPLPHGPSTVQESVLAPDLLAQSDQLMQRLAWRGIAEVEWMVDPRDGQAKLMEINPRFWNSLHLAIVCGVNFVQLLYDLATGGDCATVSEYPLGVRNRSLLPEDTLHWLRNPHRRTLDPPFWPPVQKGLHDDLLASDDPLPVLGLMLQVLASAGHPRAWRQMFVR